MAIERPAHEERQARIDRMIEEFRAAQRRRLVKLGVALWTRTETGRRHLAFDAKLPGDKIN